MPRNRPTEVSDAIQEISSRILSLESRRPTRTLLRTASIHPMKSYRISIRSTSTYPPRVWRKPIPRVWRNLSRPSMPTIVAVRVSMPTIQPAATARKSSCPITRAATVSTRWTQRSSISCWRAGSFSSISTCRSSLPTMPSASNSTSRSTKSCVTFTRASSRISQISKYNGTSLRAKVPWNRYAP